MCEQTVGPICLQLLDYRRQSQWSHLLSRALNKYESSIWESTSISVNKKRTMKKIKEGKDNILISIMKR